MKPLFNYCEFKRKYWAIQRLPNPDDYCNPEEVYAFISREIKVRMNVGGELKTVVSMNKKEVPEEYKDNLGKYKFPVNCRRRLNSGFTGSRALIEERELQRRMNDDRFDDEAEF